MSNEDILNPINSTSMMSAEAQQVMQQIYSENQKQSDAPDLSNASSNNSSNNLVPTDEQTIILGLIEYLRTASDHSLTTDQKEQANWFMFCSDWVKAQYEKAGYPYQLTTNRTGPWFNNENKAANQDM